MEKAKSIVADNIFTGIHARHIWFLLKMYIGSLKWEVIHRYVVSLQDRYKTGPLLKVSARKMDSLK